MDKAAVRNLFAQTCRVTGILQSRERAARTQLTVLCYHRILPSADKAAYFCPDLVVTPEAFRAHCRTLSRHYTVLPINEAVIAHDAGPREKPLVALTFDDGYSDNLQYAAPILAEFGLRATFFVVSSLVGAPSPPWYDLVARYVSELSAIGEGSTAQGSPIDLAHGLSAIEVVENAKNFSPEARHLLVATLTQRLHQDLDFQNQDLIMNQEQLRELTRAGHEIGSHSVSHEILPSLEEKALTNEIHNSKKQLEEILEGPISSFCYPNGDFDSRTVELVSSGGYSQAVSTKNGSNDKSSDPLTLHRRFIHEDRLADSKGVQSSTLFRAEVSGLHDWLRLRWVRSQ